MQEPHKGIPQVPLGVCESSQAWPSLAKSDNLQGLQALAQGVVTQPWRQLGHSPLARLKPPWVYHKQDS